MSKPLHNTKPVKSASTTTQSNLPGMDGVQVIVAKPILVKENSSKTSKK